MNAIDQTGGARAYAAINAPATDHRPPATV
jgi:hypothetical protein